ncbi:MazG-like family protein [Streptomyces sp. NPDC005865]|uniref:MazG-like family protein n=1 Tax=Streptomyces sp. NPDC005865 TaxID=3155453 RepID=UPI0034064D00
MDDEQGTPDATRTPGATPTPEAPPPPEAPRQDPWDTVERLHAWLDSHNRRESQEALLLRMLKLSEEVGEVAAAVIGATGQNPRKGTTHTWDDVRSELCDVIVTAMVALRTLTPDAAAVLAAHLRHVDARAKIVSPPTG